MFILIKFFFEFAQIYGLDYVAMWKWSAGWSHERFLSLIRKNIACFCLSVETLLLLSSGEGIQVKRGDNEKEKSVKILRAGVLTSLW